MYSVYDDYEFFDPLGSAYDQFDQQFHPYESFSLSIDTNQLESNDTFYATNEIDQAIDAPHEQAMEGFVSNVIDCIEKEQKLISSQSNDANFLKSFRKYFMSLRKKVKSINITEKSDEEIYHQIRLIVNETIDQIMKDGWNGTKEDVVSLCISLYNEGLAVLESNKFHSNSRGFISNKLVSELFSYKYNL